MVHDRVDPVAGGVCVSGEEDPVAACQGAAGVGMFDPLVEDRQVDGRVGAAGVDCCCWLVG